MAVYNLLTCLTSSRYIQRSVIIIFLSEIYITKSLFTSYSALLFWYQLFLFFAAGCSTIKCHYLLSPPSRAPLGAYFHRGGLSGLRESRSTASDYIDFVQGLLIYRCAVLRSVRCVVLCCVLCCVLWRDGAWDGGCRGASISSVSSTADARGRGKIMVREAASTGFGLLVGRGKLQLKQSSPPPWPPPRRRRP